MLIPNQQTGENKNPTINVPTTQRKPTESEKGKYIHHSDEFRKSTECDNIAPHTSQPHDLVGLLWMKLSSHNELPEFQPCFTALLFYFLSFCFQCTKNLPATLLAPFVPFNIWSVYNTPTAGVVNPLAEIGDFDEEARVLAGVPRVPQQGFQTRNVVWYDEQYAQIPGHNFAEFLTSAYDSACSRRWTGRCRTCRGSKTQRSSQCRGSHSGKYWHRSELCLPRPWFSLAAIAALADQATTVLPGGDGSKNANGDNKQ
nr:hypothetical protein Iba_chr03fCG0690 [Ipomoea batatas]